MLHYSLVFLVFALIAAFPGFWGIAGLAATIAKICFFVFLVVWIVTMLMGRRSVLWRSPGRTPRFIACSALRSPWPSDATYIRRPGD